VGYSFGGVDGSFFGDTMGTFKRTIGASLNRDTPVAQRGAGHMSSKRGAALAAAALIAVLIGASVVPSTAQQSPPPIAVELLTDRAVFTDNVDLKLKNKLDGKATEVTNVKNPSRTVTARFTVQPGAVFGWHTHPGPVVVNVAQGGLTYVAADDCVQRRYPAGTAFIDAGGDHVHNAFNHTGGPTVLVATFFGMPQTGPVTIQRPPPADCVVP
jgi:quercetin dioxygenase-like cupin family protein